MPSSDPEAGDKKALTLERRFAQMSRVASRWAGHPWAFLCAAALVAGWLITGPVFHYSDTWQLVINTGTTIITFLMVFLIQNSQNRDSEEIMLKLNELIRARDEARNEMLCLEELDEKDLKRLRETYSRLGSRSREDAPGADGKSRVAAE
ncbi:MAG TPA: low affinity iron permease family protein [Burkholderiales bacterium]|jgi:low affinity Fe/Cu permease